MMRLVFFMPSFSMGGAEKVTLQLVKHFSRNYDVSCIVMRDDGELRQLFHEACPVEALCARGVFDSFRTLMKSQRIRGAVMVCGHMSTMISAVLARIFRGRDFEVVTCVHGDLTFRSGPIGLREKLYGVLIRLLLPQSAAVVAVSEGIARLLKNTFPGIGQRVAVVYNPVLESLPAIQGNGQLRTSSHIPVVLSVGRLSAPKDFKTLLRAFAKLQRFVKARLLVLGDGPERSELEGLTAQLDLGESVEFRGFVDDIGPFLREADLFVLSSRSEGAPNVLVEALAAGVPVVATDCAVGPRELLAGGQFGRLVSVGDVDALASAMQEELEHKGNRAGHGSALSHWLEQFTVDFAASRYEDVLLNVWRARMRGRGTL